MTLSSGKSYCPEMRIYYPENRRSISDKHLMPHKMLFTFHDVSRNLESLLQNWIEKGEILKPVYSLYFGGFHDPSPFNINSFLNIIQALESYDRRVGSNEEIPIHDHKARIHTITESVPEQYREWLGGRLRYSNEPALRKRLKHIFAERSSILGFEKSQEQRLIKSIVDTRNYFTHYDKDLKRQAITGEELFWLAQLLGWVMVACLLQEIGMTKEQISSAIMRNEDFLFCRDKIGSFLGSGDGVPTG